MESGLGFIRFNQVSIEPLSKASDKLITWKKEVFLIALASGKRRGDIHPFEHALSCRPRAGQRLHYEWVCLLCQRRKCWLKAPNVFFYALSSTGQLFERRHGQRQIPVPCPSFAILPGKIYVMEGEQTLPLCFKS